MPRIYLEVKDLEAEQPFASRLESDNGLQTFPLIMCVNTAIKVLMGSQ